MPDSTVSPRTGCEPSGCSLVSSPLLFPRGSWAPELHREGDGERRSALRQRLALPYPEICDFLVRIDSGSGVTTLT